MGSQFENAITALGTVRDNDIYVTRIGHSGTRFHGFKHVDCGEFSRALSEFSQDATFTIASDGKLSITCMPQNETLTTASLSVHDLTKPPHSMERGQEIVYAGSVSMHKFRIPSTGFTSNTAGALLAHPRTINVFVDGGSVVVQQLHDRQIKQGLAATLSSQRASGTKTKWQRPGPRGASSRHISRRGRASVVGKNSLRSSRARLNF